MTLLLYALALLLLAGVLALLLYRQLELFKTAAIVCITAGCLTGLAALPPFLSGAAPQSLSWNWLQFLTLSLRLDALSAYFLLPVFLIAPLAAIYGFHYLFQYVHAARTSLSYFCFALLIASMAAVVCAGNLLTLALAWEVMSISSYFLVLYEFQRHQTRRAGYLYIVFAQAGAICLFAAFGLMYSYTGNFSFTALAHLPEQGKLLVFSLLLLGFGSKAGIFPLHIWLPYAHPAAPSHISATMSGVMIKVGIYGILRMYFLLDSNSLLLGQIVLTAGMVSGVLGVVYALGKHDIKRLLAYHSVENIGIILIGIGLGMIGLAVHQPLMAVFGFAGGLLHVLNHSIFKSLLFMGAGVVGRYTKSRHVDAMGGAGKAMPLTSGSFLIGSISISGLPPFNGFISEFLIYYAAFQGLSVNGAVFIFSCLAIISLAVIGGLAAGCFAKVYGIVFLGEPRTAYKGQAGDAPWTMTAPQLLLAGSCLLIGVWPGPFVELAFAALHGTTIAPMAQTVDFSQLTGNLALIARLLLLLLLLAVLLQRWLYQGKKISRGPTWGCGFTQPTARMQYTGTSFAEGMVGFYQPFVRIRRMYQNISRIFPEKTGYDHKVDDIAELALDFFLVRPMLKILDMLRWIQHGNIQIYIGYIVLAILVLLAFI